MPKQNIYPHPNPDGTNADRRVEVGWQREQGVRVGVTVLQPGAVAELEYFHPDGTRTPVVGASVTTTNSAPLLARAWDGAFVDLDRAQINKLIRVLREARDAAYGRDE